MKGQRKRCSIQITERKAAMTAERCYRERYGLLAADE
jgi:hypothetical protein